MRLLINENSYTRTFSLYSDFIQHHHIMSTKLLNQGFLRNRLIFQKDVLKISTPCCKVVCQLSTDDERWY